MSVTTRYSSPTLAALRATQLLQLKDSLFAAVTDVRVGADPRDHSVLSRELQQDEQHVAEQVFTQLGVTSLERQRWQSQ